MEVILEAFISAFYHILEPRNFMFLLIATLVGFFMGAIPGLGGPIGMALLIPITFVLDPITAFIMFAALKGGTNFGGSLTAILINTPGTAPNAATLIDGYPMTQKGESRRAIGASASASAIGAVIGVVVLVLSIPVMLEIVTWFGSPETFWLGMLGIVMVGAVLQQNLAVGLISGCLGLLIAMHGRNLFTGTRRWTYDMPILYDGFPLVPVFIGIFAVAEMLKLVSEGGVIATDAKERDRTESNPDISDAAASQFNELNSQLLGVKDTLKHKWLVVRCSLIGVTIGMIPGVGGVSANFIAYFQAVQTSTDKESFGKGDVRGVIAAESSNDAKDGGAFVPTLGFGIPGSATMAVLFGGFLIHGIQPGPRLINDHLDIVGVIVIALIISNILTSIIGYSTATLFSHVAKIDIYYIAPIVIFTALMGAYAINNMFMGMVIGLAFGIIGYVMIQINMSRIPFVLGFVLAPIIEENFIRSVTIGNGDPTFFVASTTSKVLALVVLITLLNPFVDWRAVIRRFSGRII